MNKQYLFYILSLLAFIYTCNAVTTGKTIPSSTGKTIPFSTGKTIPSSTSKVITITSSLTIPTSSTISSKTLPTNIGPLTLTISYYPIKTVLTLPSGVRKATTACGTRYCKVPWGFSCNTISYKNNPPKSVENYKSYTKVIEGDMYQTLCEVYTLSDQTVTSTPTSTTTTTTTKNIPTTATTTVKTDSKITTVTSSVTIPTSSTISSKTLPTNIGPLTLTISYYPIKTVLTLPSGVRKATTACGTRYCKVPWGFSCNTISYKNNPPKSVENYKSYTKVIEGEMYQTLCEVYTLSDQTVTSTPTSTTTKTIPTTTTTTTTTTTAITSTKCLPVTITVTEKEKKTITEKETVTVTIQSGPTDEPVDDTRCVSKWAQCGGVGYNGPTCCQSGSTCRELNKYFSQCV